MHHNTDELNEEEEELNPLHKEGLITNFPAVCLYPVVRLNRGSESSKVYFPHHHIESESSATLSLPDSSLADYGSNYAVQLRQNFNEFISAASPLEKDVEQYFAQIKKSIQVKIGDILRLDELANCSEKILTRVLTSAGHSRKNWSEEETLLLVSIICYYCLLKNEDHSTLVIKLVLVPRL